MAIDTRRKRTSMMRNCQPWVAVLPVPDGAFDQGDRQMFLAAYSGILWGVAVIPPFLIPAATMDTDFGYFATVES